MNTQDLAELFHPEVPELDAAAPFDAELAALIGLAAEPVEPPASLRDKVLGGIRRPKTVRRPLLREEVTGVHVLRAGAGDWKATEYPGIFSKLLFLDKNTGLITSLMKIEPGATYPSHRHSVEEQTYVIVGDLKIGGIHLDAGDYSTAEPGTTHGIITSERGCVALVMASIHDEVYA